ncbi:M28 family peptidase [Chryseosolibacter indicus]|uniref:Carboxypeptidase Q n=1 Tax=Chryseosolibacter indicus TaxID=2782351 RepID=A0ABS5VTY4_9BACT|nr:M28 family peptidase [Chryseosolibacter indicus]MBT1704287.1 M28 family peptidase [Chryseosolibacter indicus]
MQKLTLLFIFCFSGYLLQAQNQDEATIKKIFDQELTNGKSYQMLEYLATKIGARLSGSPGAAAAVDWTRHTMLDFADSVWLQPVKVPHWVRGAQEIGKVTNSRKRGTIDMSICALGGSVGTGAAGVTANVVEVKNFDELKQLGQRNIQGKIVFFNRPMDATKINTFTAYSGAVDQRASGPSEAAKYGAVGAIIRSMGSTLEDYPHTGGLRYAPNIPQIPAVAISTKDAELLSRLLKEERDLQFYFETHCQTFPDAPSFNVIGEIKGSLHPEEIIVVSGHLDSWDLSQGAHDDGAGCVQAMEVIRLFKAIGYKPLRTIRAVMYMNEENGLRGGIEYAKQSELKKEKHLAAMESDRGGFTPRGFTMSAPENVVAKVKAWKPLLEPFGLTDFDQQGGGADIGPLANQNVPLFGFLPDSQRYFNYHHTKEDTFDKVNQRELEFGAAAMAALTYLIDQHGL